MTAPTPITMISRGQPVSTNDDFGGAFPATNANNATYGGTNYWRCASAPAGGADSGPLTTPVHLAYDLSSIPSGQRQSVLLYWLNDPTTDNYNSALIGQNYFNVPSSYTIETNSAAGGSYPVAGWTTRATIAGSPYHSRQHLITMAEDNWIQINVSAVLGSGGGVNSNVAINMDVFDVSAGASDTWLFLGDSITARGLDHDDISLGPVLSAQIQALHPANLPTTEDGGIGGFTAADAATNISTWLGITPAHFIALNYGTNDANSGGILVTNFQANMTTCINAVIAAGKIPVIPTIPWGNTAGLLANVPTLNAVIAGLYNTFPSIIHGPDLYSFFNANQSLISGDGIHPTDPAGYLAYRQQWAQALVANVYALAGAGSPLIIHKKAPGRILV